MSKMCEICGKKPMVGNNVSHAHNINKRRFNPNLQRFGRFKTVRPNAWSYAPAASNRAMWSKRPEQLLLLVAG